MALDDAQMKAEMRERFLRFLGQLNNKEVTCFMYENTSVKAKVGGVKSDLSHVVVEKLKTPIGILDAAVLRTSDMLVLSVDGNEFNKK